MVIIEIKLNKHLNRVPIEFKKEIGMRFFKEVVYKFNKTHNLDDEIILTNKDLKELLNLKDSIDLKKFQEDFHNSDEKVGIFKAILETPKGETISGGLLLTKVDRNQTGITVRINPFWKDYFYSRLDIDQWHKVKGDTEEIKCLELEENQQEKLLNMMSSVINHSVKGKYSQRLVDLLYQFKETGFFVMDWGNLKKVLEVPTSYRASDIDKWVLNPAKEELKKVGIKITKIDKVKKGRSIDKIKIFFKMENFKKVDKTEVLEAEIVEDRGAIDKAILKAKRNIFVSKAWNKRVDNKINKLLKDRGEEVTLNLLERVYKELKTEIKTTLVQYLNGIIKNMDLEQEEEQDKQNKKAKSTKTPVKEVEELKKEIREPKKETLEEYKNIISGKVISTVGINRGMVIAQEVGKLETKENIQNLIRSYEEKLNIKVI